MGLIGKMLSMPLKVVNAPIRACEDLFEEATGGKDFGSEDRRLLSKPLELLGDQIEKIDE